MNGTYLHGQHDCMVPLCKALGVEDPELVTEVTVEVPREGAFATVGWKCYVRKEGGGLVVNDGSAVKVTKRRIVLSTPFQLVQSLKWILQLPPQLISFRLYVAAGELAGLDCTYHPKPDPAVVESEAIQKAFAAIQYGPVEVVEHAVS